eukprot:CAMPEP_0119494990 /NCGR_PEP_ID=MMETSP1344-20130328/18759_1 /TAXON_ID=236787 /ORGANISM="Florenciella parvula, Strain CCMP2471" /LENGTH=133 /DNA_ID=CAMNT_0007530537 /DNA_START=1408 /DNA_END=1807 /DNA_ORIENTATION=-
MADGDGLLGGLSQFEERGASVARLGANRFGNRVALHIEQPDLVCQLAHSLAHLCPRTERRRAVDKRRQIHSRDAAGFEWRSYHLTVVTTDGYGVALTAAGELATGSAAASGASLAGESGADSVGESGALERAR